MGHKSSHKDEASSSSTTTSSPSDEQMVPELQKCPVMYATTSDYVVIMARMSNDAEKLAVSASVADGTNLSTMFDAKTLTPIKTEWGSAEMPWNKFFIDMQGMFNRNQVSFTGSNTVVLKPENGSNKMSFKLSSTSERVQESILSALLSYHHTHVHLKEVEKQTEETKRQQAEVTTQADELQKEEVSLNDLLTRNKEQDGVNTKRLSELSQQLAEAEAEKAKNGGDEVEEEDEDTLLCRARLPMGKRDCKDVNPDLLRMVKSRYISNDSEQGEEMAPDHAYNRITRPMTTSELTQYTSALTDEQRKLVWSTLEKLDEWDYNVFDMQTAMAGNDTASLANQPNGGALFLTCYAIMFRTGLMQKLRIDEQLFVNWLSCVEAGYHPNPYHNSMHAADVLHISYYIVTKGGMAKKCNMSDEDVFACIFAATIHDYDHPGINNSFHVKAQTYLAYLYNDRSILENKHVSTVFEIMKLPRYNVMTTFSEDTKRDLRDTIIEVVLATDMGLHGKYVSQFKKRLQENHDLVKKDDIRLALAMAVKMADISNCGRPSDLYLRWSSKISDEFYMQGDRERNLGMPCSPFMDRLQPAMAKGQIAFMNYIVIPLFDCISELVPNMRFTVDHTDANKSYWTKNDDSAV